MATSIPTARAIVRCNNEVDAMDASVDTDGYFRLFSGTVPTNAEEALGAQVAHVDIPCPKPAYGDAQAGGVGAEAMLNGNPSGTATVVTTQGNPLTFFRAYDGDDNTLRQGSVSLAGGGGQMIISAVDITAVGQVITIEQAKWSERTEAA